MIWGLQATVDVSSMLTCRHICWTCWCLWVNACAHMCTVRGELCSWFHCTNTQRFYNYMITDFLYNICIFDYLMVNIEEMHIHHSLAMWRHVNTREGVKHVKIIFYVWQEHGYIDMRKGLPLALECVWYQGNYMWPFLVCPTGLYLVCFGCNNHAWEPFTPVGELLVCVFFCAHGVDLFTNWSFAVLIFCWWIVILKSVCNQKPWHTMVLPSCWFGFIPIWSLKLFVVAVPWWAACGTGYVDVLPASWSSWTQLTVSAAWGFKAENWQSCSGHGFFAWWW